MTRSIAFAFASLAALQSAQAQTPSDVPVDCVANMVSEQFASDYADAYSAGLGSKDGDDALIEQSAAYVVECADRYGVSGQEALVRVHTRNLGHMVAQQLKQRIVDFGLNLGAIDNLVAAKLADPALSIGDYIDSRPSEFAEVGRRVAAETELTECDTIILTAGYLSARLNEESKTAEAGVP